MPGHVLIVPVSHQQRYSELSAAGAKEAERYKESFRRCGMTSLFIDVLAFSFFYVRINMYTAVCLPSTLFGV